MKFNQNITKLQNSKRAIFIARIILFGIFITDSPARAQSWEYVGSPGFSPASLAVIYSFIAINASDTPYVMYTIHSDGSHVMKYSDGSWAFVGGGFGTLQYDYMALDTGGTPYVINQDVGTFAEATVVKYDRGSWVTVGRPDFSFGTVMNCSLAFDRNGTPYAAFDCSASSANNASVMKFADSVWVLVGGREVSAGMAEYLTLAIDGSGTPYVAYRDDANGYKATVMKYNDVDSNWVSVGTVGFSSGAAAYTYLAINSGGTPYIAYQDSANSNKATVMKYTDAGSWVNVGSAGFSAGAVAYTSLAIDSSGTPFVAYQDSANGNGVTVMKYNGSAWVSVGSVNFSGGTAEYTSIALNSSGIPYVVFSDGNYSGQASVMKPGAWLGIKNTDAAAVALSLFPNPSNGAFTMNIAAPENEEATVTITNMLGEKVKELTTTTNKLTKVTLQQLAGMYFIQVVTNGGSVNEKIVIE